MRDEVVVHAPAKINLQLGVGPVRKDGFHPLATVYQAIGVYDEIIARPAKKNQLSVVGDGVDVSDVPTDESNLVLKAAALLAARHGLDEAVEVVILKRIPVAGGMAGGSADAAGALVALDALWETHTPRDELLAIAAQLGSDVPFCLVGGTAIGSGRGEVVTPAMTRGHYWWVVALAEDGLSTAEVYAEFDRMHDGMVADPLRSADELMSALRSGDVEKLGLALSNDLEAPALRLRPELQAVLTGGLEHSAYAAMVSGSGPTCLFLAESETHASQVQAGLDSAGVTTVLYAPGPVSGARVVR